jgi:hypothetical protein
VKFSSFFENSPGERLASPRKKRPDLVRETNSRVELVFKVALNFTTKALAHERKN